MPLDAILAILLVAIALNLLLMLAVVVSAIRERRERAIAGPREEAAPSPAAPVELATPPTPEPGAEAPLPEGAPTPARRGRRFSVPRHQDDHRATRAIETFLEPSSGAGRAVGPGREALTDGLVEAETGFGNGDAWDQWLGEARARWRRRHKPLAVVLLDVAPSAAADVADVLRPAVRSADRIARIAPGRYALLLVDADERQAEGFVARLRASLAGTGVLRSIGWAGALEAGGVDAALQAALGRLDGALS